MVPSLGRARHVDHLLLRAAARSSTMNCSITAVLICTFETLLVPIDQLLDRARQILVRRDDRDERTDIELADDHE